MDYAYLGIVVFLFLLAIVDLVVGVSNDAVNFLGSAVGSKAAPLKRIMIIAAIGIFIGAATSNGMMDIARHGIFQPEHYYFSEIMCILLAVVVSDVILLDIFNSLGLPTSTTVSMVFELLGASCVIAAIKLLGDNTGLTFAELINTEKALAVIISIFVSVAIAFFFGTIVQWISRLIFTFRYNHHLTGKIGIFGGIAATSIIYFMLIKGMKQASFMTADAKDWVNNNVVMIVLCSFLFFTILMQVLYWMKINVLKIIVLLGTFALAMAFAGNDLVNFIGVTLAGYSSFIDFTQNAAGAGVDSYLMTSLNGPSSTPIYFLLGAGAIMVLTLALSKKSRKVLQTSIDLSRQEEGDEMFGTSRVARFLVRTSSNAAETIVNLVPEKVQNWVDKRFNREIMDVEEGASFDLIRASVNLVLSGLLVAIGTSFKLPLSTTYVAFMVAMGSSLADRAWGRESAVYRVTGVVSVIGGWFVTAAAAFAIAAVSVLIMYYGGMTAMIAMIAMTAFVLIRSHVAYAKKAKETDEDLVMSTIMHSHDSKEIWSAMQEHTSATLADALSVAAEKYLDMYQSFTHEKRRELRLIQSQILDAKADFKYMRNRELRGLMRADRNIVYEKSTWYHLATTCTQQMFNTLLRICCPMREHTDNNFRPLPKIYVDEFSPYCRSICHTLSDMAAIIRSRDFSQVNEVSFAAKTLKQQLSELRRRQIDRMQDNREGAKVAFVYLNLIQESHEILSQVRNVLRGSEKFFSKEKQYSGILEFDAPSLMITSEEVACHPVA